MGTEKERPGEGVETLMNIQYPTGNVQYPSECASRPSAPPKGEMTRETRAEAQRRKGVGADLCVRMLFLVF